MFKFFFNLERQEKIQISLGGFIFFCIVGAYTLIKEIQHITFISLVGVENYPYGKIFSLIYLSLIAILDGYLVDRLKRYQLLLCYSIAYCVIGMLISGYLYLISNDTNSHSSIVGWVYFLYAEAYYPMLIGVFWAFMNSMSTTNSGDRIYGLLAACSKVGGLFCAGVAYFFLSYCLQNQISQNFFQLSILSLLASSMLLFVSVTLSVSFGRGMFRFKSYQTIVKNTSKKTGALSGLKELINKRYVLMILLLVLLTNALYEVISYQRLVILTKSNSDFTIRTLALFKQIIQMHSVGFLICVLGTNTLFRVLGARKSLFVLPIVSLILIAAYVITNNGHIITYMYIIFTSLIYSITIPAVETLYIVTNKDIQFKSKFLMDTYGLKLGRGLSHLFNSFYNYISMIVGTIITQMALNSYLLLIIISMLILSRTLIKKYEHAERNKIVI